MSRAHFVCSFEDKVTYVFGPLPFICCSGDKVTYASGPLYIFFHFVHVGKVTYVHSALFVLCVVLLKDPFIDRKIESVANRAQPCKE
jgi:hypothetical protein